MQNYFDSVHQRNDGSHDNQDLRRKEYTLSESKGGHTCSNYNLWCLHKLLQPRKEKERQQTQKQKTKKEKGW